MQPENRHVTFNVDVKVFSDPTRLFTLMHEIIAGQPNWQTDLAPRILLGLWHPRFIQPAKTILPYCKRSFIGRSTWVGKQYFWDSCEVFSINFGSLISWEGQRCVSGHYGYRILWLSAMDWCCSFREECKKAGKKVMAWTVNDAEEMVEVRPRVSKDVIPSIQLLIRHVL